MRTGTLESSAITLIKLLPPLGIIKSTLFSDLISWLTNALSWFFNNCIAFSGNSAEIKPSISDYAIKILSHLLSKSNEFKLDEKAITNVNFLLGKLYFEHYEVRKQEENIDHAIKYLKKASAQNNIEAVLGAAESLRKKYSITNDLKYNEESKLYYLQAASLGSAEAMIYLGNIYLENHKTDEEKIKGLGWVLTGYSKGKIDRDLERKVINDISKIDKTDFSILRPLVISCHEQKYKNCFLTEN